MTGNEIKEKYLKFFIEKPRSHREIIPAPLVLEGDATTLFTSAGMQPLIPYLKGETHPKGRRLVDVQPSLRLQDIDEVGDNRHTTFFEMLGNWSLGDYFKKEQLSWIFEFFTKVLKIPVERLWVTVFGGAEELPRDNVSWEIWKRLGIPEDHIVTYGFEKNWWSRAGEPKNMPAGEIGGPDTEIFFEFAGVKHDPKFGRECHPNCNCGRFLEIGNSVFIEYEKTVEGSLKKLPRACVDFGGGLERIAAVLNHDPDIFKTDIFLPIIKKITSFTQKSYRGNEVAFRIIADHLRAAEKIAGEGIYPSGKLQGYVLRRLIRKAALKIRGLKSGFDPSELKKLTENATLIEEILKFQKCLKVGEKEIAKLGKVTGKEAFNLYQSCGLPLEVTLEILAEKGEKINLTEFENEFEKHRNLSRTASAGIFKGGLAESGQNVARLHTATHLLHAALRKVLGEHVSQKGSNINASRLRFDFSHPQKLTERELKKVADLINEVIAQKISVTNESLSLAEAIKRGALHFFAEKYGQEVSVYKIGDFSLEICGGPHVKNTGEIGHVRIIKQEKVGAGIVRIYATLD